MNSKLVFGDSQLKNEPSRDRVIRKSQVKR